MNIIKTVTVGFLAMFMMITLPVASRADSAQRHRWEGVAIGVSAAIIGGALINSLHDGQREAARPVARVNIQHRPHRRPSAPAGYWKTERIWVPTRYERVWRPGHHTPHGRWLPGAWIQIETRPGHWEERQVWAGCR